MHHVHKELHAIWLVLRSRCRMLVNRRVCIFVDAITSVAYINNWGGPSLTCCRLVKKIWGVCAWWGIRIVQISHISGELMITVGVDALSRPFRFARGKEADRDEWRLRDDMFAWLQQQIFTAEGFTIDRMASRSNTRCKAYCSISSVDPDSQGSSALMVDWNVQHNVRSPMNYCFPPFALIPRVIQHVRECKAWAVIVVLEWPSQCWWPDLMRDAVHTMSFPAGPVFERVCDGEWQSVSVTSFRPLAVTLHASRWREAR